MVRPHLKFWVQFWASHYKRNVDTVEKVQQRAIKKGEYFSFEERLRELGLEESWKKRRLREISLTTNTLIKLLSVV